MKKRQFCVAGGMEAAVTTTLRTKAAGTLLLCAVLALAGCDNGISPGSGGDSGGDTTYAPGALMTRTVSGKEIKFRYVPSGSFRRDSMAANVTVITQGYWLGETEVTHELFQAVMGTNWDREAKHPVYAVGWFEAIAFCNKLSVADGKNPVYSVSGISDWANLAYSSIPMSSGDVPWYVTQDLNKNGYRLPTEMEWMWAAMGADKSAQPNTSGYYKPFAGSNGSNSIEDCAWFSGDMRHEVGKKTANELNLFDMSGNVFEWVWDWYGSYSSGASTDPSGPAFGTSRMLRGGSVGVNASGCTVAFRRFEAPTYRANDFGFRVLAAAQ